ncbi:hypothetical protein Ga0466249_001883 [Sporomusaceae bacterium BoRhaA]|uniref:DUF4280 domain-containing protein n=1 Tax=Pelorhabdus rhamnosifermentans TaxID=2772457 RepID=UPI001C062272|nr:DUF4280 domain-containing protein [Pelorhabdus rhamnosifermentans]MBU2700778.1 hypothetical protein [Pelorhabdus rhamnosifermentans]
MDTRYVVRGATVRCNKGSTASRLNLPKSHGVYVNEKAVLNDHDCISGSNVMPFGTCSMIHKCSPFLALKWEQAKDTTLVKGQPALLATSTLSCAVGGVITVVDDGQRGW